VRPTQGQVSSLLHRILFDRVGRRSETLAFRLAALLAAACGGQTTANHIGDTGSSGRSSGACDPQTGLTVLASGQDSPSSIAVGPTAAYWSAGTGLMQVPLCGGVATTFASAGANAMVVDGSSLYWINYDAVMSLPLGGGTPTTLLTGAKSEGGIAVDATSVYWTARDDGTIKRAPKQ
jgi:hypothetical protein